MQPIRYDELESVYGPVRRLDAVATYVFWLTAVASVVFVMFQPDWPAACYRALEIGIPILALAHTFISNFNAFFLTPNAEKMRRRQLLSDAFDAPLTVEHTQSYYNNELQVPIHRLGANVLENSFFAKNVCKRMQVTERLKAALILIIWLTFIFIRETPTALLVVVTQLIFSGDVFFRAVRLEVLTVRLNRVYQNLYTLFLTHSTESRKEDLFSAHILDNFAYYECAKTGSSIVQSSRVFFSLNERLSNKWNKIAAKLRLNEALS